MIRILLVGVCCLLVIGCGSGGPKTVPVSGTVTMDGSPIANAVVTFVPSGEGTAATGTTDASGKYSLNTAGKEGAMLGSYTVKVIATSAPAAAAAEMSSDSEEYAKMSSADYAAQSEAQSVKQTIPEKYNTKSELTYEVVSGDNTFNIEMTSK